MDDNVSSLQDKLKRVSDAINQFDYTEDKMNEVSEHMRLLLSTLTKSQSDNNTN